MTNTHSRMRKTLTLKTLLLLSCLSVLTPEAFSQPPLRGDHTRRRQPSGLYQVYRYGKSGEKRIGFIDKTGRLVIGFDRLPEGTMSVGEFHDGRAMIQVKKEGVVEPKSYHDYAWGYIDETGTVVIAPRFLFPRDFSEGLAYAGAEGFINLRGKTVIKLAGYFAEGDFHEGLAAVMPSEGKREWGYIDRSGRMVIKGPYSFAGDFSEGLAAVQVGGKYGFINKRGKMVIPPSFDVERVEWFHHQVTSLGRFSEGLACVLAGGLYGYINKKGGFAIPPQFSKCQEFSGGLAWVVNKDEKTNVVNKVGWIDKSGRWVVTGVNGRTFSPPELFSYANEWQDWRYSESLVPFFVYSGNSTLHGYMDQKGEVAIQPGDFNKVDPFGGGVAKVFFHGRTQSGEDKYGYIDRRGQFIWRPQ